MTDTDRELRDRLAEASYLAECDLPRQKWADLSPAMQEWWRCFADELINYAPFCGLAIRDSAGLAQAAADHLAGQDKAAPEREASGVGDG